MWSAFPSQRSAFSLSLVDRPPQGLPSSPASPPRPESQDLGACPLSLNGLPREGGRGRCWVGKQGRQRPGSELGAVSGDRPLAPAALCPPGGELIFHLPEPSDGRARPREPGSVWGSIREKHPGSFLQEREVCVLPAWLPGDLSRRRVLTAPAVAGRRRGAQDVLRQEDDCRPCCSHCPGPCEVQTPARSDASLALLSPDPSGSETL